MLLSFVTFACLDPKVVSAWRVPNQRCWHVGQLVGSCMMTAPARATDEPARLPSLQDYVAQNKDFLVGTAGAVATVAGSYFTYLQADKAFRASDEYKIKQAVEKFLQPYEISDPEAPVVKRHVMQTIKANITAWSRQAKKTTIVTGRYQAGKTVAVNDALRGVRGVFQVSVQDASWKEAMYKELGVGDYGMFKQVLRRVAVELQKMPDNPTSYPILLLEVPRQAPAGAGLLSVSLGMIASLHMMFRARRKHDGDGVQHGEGFGSRCSRQCTNPRPTFCILSLA